VQPNAPLYLLETGDINDRGEITGLACVVVDGACGNEMHTFVAIVAPGSSAALHEHVAAAVRPQLSAALRSALEHHHLARIGERVAATRQ
jgi:hypothetical protein